MALRLLRAWMLLPALLGLPVPALALKEPVQLWEEVYVRVRPGATVHARFHLSVEPGYFVVGQGPLPSDPLLRPLALTMKPAAGLEIGSPVFPPPPANAALEGLPEFPAYEGLIAISLPLTVPKQAAWSKRRLEGRVEYQICTTAGCRPPASLPVTIEVELSPNRESTQ
jgi:hypothetical protein